MAKYKLTISIPEKRVVVQEKKIIEIELESTEYIGKKIAYLRKEMKIRQQDFSNSIGISRTSLSNIESGRQQLSLKLLEKICVVLKCKSSNIIPF